MVSIAQPINPFSIIAQNTGSLLDFAAARRRNQILEESERLKRAQIMFDIEAQREAGIEQQLKNRRLEALGLAVAEDPFNPFGATRTPGAAPRAPGSPGAAAAPVGSPGAAAPTPGLPPSAMPVGGAPGVGPVPGVDVPQDASGEVNRRLQVLRQNPSLLADLETPELIEMMFGDLLPRELKLFQGGGEVLGVDPMTGRSRTVGTTPVQLSEGEALAKGERLLVKNPKTRVPIPGEGQTEIDGIVFGPDGGVVAIDATKFDPESVKAFRESGNVDALRRVMKLSEGEALVIGDRTLLKNPKTRAAIPGEGKTEIEGIIFDAEGDVVAIDPTIFTPETVESYRESGNLDDLRRIEEKDKPTAAEVKALGERQVRETNFIRDMGQLGALSRTIFEASQLRALAGSSPGAVAGRRAELAQSLAGVLGEFGAEGVADDVISFFAGEGLTSQQLAAVQTELRTLAAANIAVLTGEQSGRISESERQIANQASRVVQTSTEPRQVLGAMTTLSKLRVINEELLRKSEGSPPLLPVDTPENRFRAGQILLRAGFTQEQADEIVVSLTDRQELRSELLGGSR